MHSMLKKDFWYDLPKELIAQEPASPRDAARLMVLSQKDDSIRHKVFRDLPEFLEPGDLLVVNNSKVLPARIVGVKQPTGAVCELLLLRQVKGDQWECLAKPGKRMQPGTKVSFGDGSLTAVVDETMEDGNKYVTFYYDTETLYEKLDEFGKMPLPPYITKQLEDQSQYQTVYAKELGSAAAPTAGLHFTPELMDTIRAMGVGIAEVTLHVGLGTFRPVQEDEISDHKMHSEWYSISEETARRIRETKAAGHRVIAVGTTSCRTLESATDENGILLGKWVSRQRYAWQNPERSSARVTPERKALLDELGMNWEKTDSWQHRYELAVEYKKEHGSLAVPAQYRTEDGIWLGSWLSRQKQMLREGKKLSAERRAALKELFKGEKGRRLSAPVPPACSVREQNWLDNYQSARLYAEKKGSLLVPAGYVDENGFRLGVWISNLRAARKARPGSFQVTPEHIALLDAIGMQWDAREAKWAGAFRRAEEYCAAHGDLLVPVNYKTEDGFCLGDWVRRMRENYACAEKKLTAERIAKLEALGMVWTVPQEG